MGRVINARSMPAQADAWTSKGYYGGGNVEGLLDSLHGRTAIVAGSAQGVFEQIESCAHIDNPVYFAANDIGVYLPDVDHLVSLHSDNLVHWAALRADKRNRQSFRTHALEDADYNWQGLCPVFPLSGYFAMQIAWLMGCDRIILCGCPGDNLVPRFFEPRPREGVIYKADDVVEMLQNEMRRVPEFKAAVRSCSGFTREFFGAPW